MKQVTAPIIASTAVVSGVYLVWLESPQTAREAQPGHFVMVRCGDGTLLRRPLSIHQRDGDRIALLFAVVGKGTRWLSERRVSETVDILGPLGNGYSIHPGSRNLLLAGGIGIAPLCFLAQQAIGQACSVTLLMGCATAAQLYPRHLLPAGVRLFIATEDGTAGEQGMVTDLVAGHAGGADQVFACGPVPMYRDMALHKQELGLGGKPVQVSLEVMMGCGRGICYGCTLKTKSGLKQVCTDGPVFDLDDIVWDAPGYWPPGADRGTDGMP